MWITELCNTGLLRWDSQEEGLFGNCLKKQLECCSCFEQPVFKCPIEITAYSVQYLSLHVLRPFKRHHICFCAWWQLYCNSVFKYIHFQGISELLYGYMFPVLSQVICDTVWVECPGCLPFLKSYRFEDISHG